MAALPAIAAPDPTLDALHRVVEDKAAAETPRAYLGMSSIGRPCERQLWYAFRWAVRERLEWNALWRFQDGFRCEDVMADRLRLVPGVTLRTVDPRTGQQFGFTDLGGHFRGHADGIISGLLQAPKAQHVWEAKATNDAKQAKLEKLKGELGEKNALKAWDGVYYAQAILYMAYAELPRHYLTCSSPGARSMVSVRTDTDLAEARKLRAKAERVITSPEPLPRINNDPAWFECKFCPARDICHGGKLPAVNRRTCAHATPEMDGDGRWSCAKCGSNLTAAQQAQACADHLYIPALVTFAEQVDANEAENWIAYRMPDGRVFRNGNRPERGEYSSEELRVMDRGMIGDAGADLIRKELDARHVAPSPLQPPDLFGRVA